MFSLPVCSTSVSCRQATCVWQDPPPYSIWIKASVMARMPPVNTACVIPESWRSLSSTEVKETEKVFAIYLTSHVGTDFAKITARRILLIPNIILENEPNRSHASRAQTSQDCLLAVFMSSTSYILITTVKCDIAKFSTWHRRNIKLSLAEAGVLLEMNHVKCQFVFNSIHKVSLSIIHFSYQQSLRADTARIHPTALVSNPR